MRACLKRYIVETININCALATPANCIDHAPAEPGLDCKPAPAISSMVRVRVRTDSSGDVAGAWYYNDPSKRQTASVQFRRSLSSRKPL